MDKCRKLVAWQRCRELVRVVYEATRTFPAEERFGLTSQLRRAAVSAAANIAEGYARYGRPELAHALSVTLGSLAEVDTLLQLARDLDLLGDDVHQRVSRIRDEASRVTFAFQRSVRR